MVVVIGQKPRTNALFEQAIGFAGKLVFESECVGEVSMQGGFFDVFQEFIAKASMLQPRLDRRGLRCGFRARCVGGRGRALQTL